MEKGTPVSNQGVTKPRLGGRREGGWRGSIPTKTRLSTTFRLGQIGTPTARRGSKRRWGMQRSNHHSDLKKNRHGRGPKNINGSKAAGTRIPIKKNLPPQPKHEKQSAKTPWANKRKNSNGRGGGKRPRSPDVWQKF